MKAKMYNFDLMEKKNKLSILLVSSYAFTREPGGVKDFILGLRKALCKNACIVKVVAPGTKDAQKKGLVDFVLGMDLKIVTDQTEFRIGFSRKETALKILEIVKPDIIVIHEPFVPSIGHTIISAVAGAKDKRSRPVIIGQFHARREKFNWSLKIAEFVVRYLIRRPKFDRRTILSFSSGYATTINNNLNARIAVSEATKKFWQKKSIAEYKIIYNGIDANRLTISGSKITSWKKEGGKIILFAGRHDPKKGIDDLLNALNILVQNGHEDILLKIAGIGEMTKTLQKIVKKLHLQKYVQFAGVLPYAVLAKAYRTADLVVAPSTGGEGFNRTIIEARSCGALVVCTDIDGHREAIGKDLSPFMAKPKNPRSLSQQIMTVLNLNEARKKRMRKGGAREVKSLFSWSSIAKQHILFYKSLISKYDNPGG